MIESSIELVKGSKKLVKAIKKLLNWRKVIKGETKRKVGKCERVAKNGKSNINVHKNIWQ